MTDLLLRLCLGKDADTTDPHIRTKIGTLSGIVGICCNLLLFACKLALGILTGAVSITADALNNLSDASSAIVTLLGFRLAGTPADAHHPYGHARLEYLSGLAVAAMILVIGFELATSSFRKILDPTPVVFSMTTALILLGAVLGALAQFFLLPVPTLAILPGGMCLAATWPVEKALRHYMPPKEDDNAWYYT